MAEKESDFSVENEGSIFLLTANNDAAGEWLEEKVPPDALWLGCRTLVVEHRFIAGIVEDLQENGFVVD